MENKFLALSRLRAKSSCQRTYKPFFREHDPKMGQAQSVCILPASWMMAHFAG
jgi:hypothetical protein